jgi:uncharacterized RDD family membrane protein YckC
MTMTTLDTRTEVETPENVTLTFDLAGPGSRTGAYLVDFFIRLNVGWGMSWALSSFVPLFGEGLPTGAIMVGFFLLEWGYSALFEGLRNGQTPGKQMFGLRVVKTAGYPIGIYDAVLRNLLRAADILPIGYGAGLVCMGCTKRMQRIGDLVAGTMVIRVRDDRFERHIEAFQNLHPLLPNDCLGRFHVSERTLDTIEKLVGRAHQLPKRRVEEIASILAEPIAKQLGYDLLSDEGLDRDMYFLMRVLRTFSTLEGVDAR